MRKPLYYEIGEAAQLSGVSIRTLHYYDEIGLLSPERSRAGYRLYGEADLLRLQQILIRRKLGLSLESIRAGLESPDFDHLGQLRRQRTQIATQIDQANRAIAAIDAAIARLSHQQESKMDMKALFDGFDPAAHDAEAQARWGETEAFLQSQRRTGDYSDAQWRTIRAEAEAIFADAAIAFRAGAPPTDPAAHAALERHRAHVSRWFYACSPAMHQALAQLWASDERFSARIDAAAPGLTDWLAAAALVARGGIEPPT